MFHVKLASRECSTARDAEHTRSGMHMSEGDARDEGPEVGERDGMSGIVRVRILCVT